MAISHLPEPRGLFLFKGSFFSPQLPRAAQMESCDHCGLLSCSLCYWNIKMIKIWPPSPSAQDVSSPPASSREPKLGRPLGDEPGESGTWRASFWTATRGQQSPGICFAHPQRTGGGGTHNPVNKKTETKRARSRCLLTWLTRRLNSSC